MKDKKDKWPNVRIMDPINQEPLTPEQLESIPRYADLQIIEKSGNIVPDSTKHRAIRIWQWQQQNLSNKAIDKLYE